MTDREILEHAFDTGFNAGRDDQTARRLTSPRMSFRQQAMTIIAVLIGGVMMVTGMMMIYQAESPFGYVLTLGSFIVFGAVIGNALLSARRDVRQLDAIMELKRQETRQEYIQAQLDLINGISIVEPEPAPLTEADMVNDRALLRA